MTPVPTSGEAWMPNGFPPPSFVVETERISTFASPRNRWLAAAAILGALLLIAGVLLIARRGDSNKTALRSGTSTTAFGQTPTSSSSAPLDPTANNPTATTGPGTPTLPVAPGAGGTGAAPGATVTPPPAAPGPTAAAGKLSVLPTTVNLPQTPPQSNKVTLRNGGGSPLTFTTVPSTKALSANPATGTIAPGASLDVTITLDGSKVAEGGFTGIVSFGGTGDPGGPRQVTVTSTVGRPPTINEIAAEPCSTETSTCTKPIKLDTPATTTATPCDNLNGWHYAVIVGVSDTSSLRSVHAIASRTAGATTIQEDVALKIGGNTAGPGGQWRSDNIAMIPAGTTLKFTIEAIGQFGDVARTTERTVTCP